MYNHKGEKLLGKNNHIQFERQSYSCVKAKAFKIREIRDRSLLELYLYFKKVTNNAHTDVDSVEVTFLKQPYGHVDLLWTCNHFEGDDLESMIGLAGFMQQLHNDCWTERFDMGIELLDAFAEKLIIQAYNVCFKFPEKAEDVVNYGVDYGEGRSKVTEDEWQKIMAIEDDVCSILN